MADKNIIGIAMELDVSDITSGLAQVQKGISESQTQFKKATAGMDNWSKSSEGLSAKLDQLNTKLELQKKGASGLEAEIKRLQESEGDHTQEIEKAQAKLTNYQIGIANTEKEIRKYESSLTDVKKKEKEAESATAKLSEELKSQKSKLTELEREYKDTILTYGKNSDEAKELAGQIKTLSSEIEDNEKKVKKADDAYNGLGSEIDKVSSIGQKALVGLGALGASVGALATKFLGTAESTREFRTSIAKLETAFETAGFSANTATATYTEFFKVLGNEDTATEAVTHLAQLCDTEEELKTWTEICTGVYGTFGDSIPINSLTEASNETAKTGTLTGALGDALKRVGVSEDEFQTSLDACNSEQERQALITETLNNLYATASERYKENNADVIASNEANAKLSQSMAEIGAMAEPIVTKLKEIGVELLNKLLPVAEEIIPFVQNNLPVIATVLGVVTGAVTALASATLIQKTYTTAVTVATTAWEAITKGVTIAQTALNAVMNANPIGLVVTAITGLVAIFTVLWNTSEDFRNFWITLWEEIKSACIEAWEGIKTAWNATVDFFNSIWNGIKKVFSGVSDWFGGIWGDAKEAVIGAWSDITSSFKDIGKNIVQGLWNGIASVKDWIVDKIKGFGGSILDGFKDFFGIHSPSTVMAEQGEYIVEGLGEGIDGKKAWLEKNVDKFSADTIDEFTEQINKEAGKEIGESLVKGVEEGVNKSKLTWTEFKKNIKNAIDGADEYLNNWQKNTGKYISKISSYFDKATGYFDDMVDAVYSYYEQENELQQEAIDEKIDNLESYTEERISIETQNANDMIKNLASSYEKELALLEQKYDNEEITYDEYLTEKKKKEQAYSKTKEKTETNLANVISQLQANQQEEEKKLLEEKNRLGREQFEANKKVQLANVAVNTASSIIRAYAELGWIAGSVAAVSLGTIAGFQIAEINKQQYTPIALAKGGVVDKPTYALVGESGTEAVMPLQNNTGWITALAEKLNMIMSKDYLSVSEGGTIYRSRSVTNNFTQVINAPKTPSRRELYRDGKNLLALKGAF